MSDTENINFDEESKLRGFVTMSQVKERKDILTKLEIPTLVDIEIAQTLGCGTSESKNKFKQQLGEIMIDAEEVLESIKLNEFSRDLDFLELQIKSVEKKLEEISKDLWVKLELTDYEDPADYYEMIKTAKSAFSRDLNHLIQEEKAIKSKEICDDLKDLCVNKVNIEVKLIDLYKCK